MKKMILTIAAVLSMAASAYATPYTFTVVENNSPIDLTAQLSVNVTQSASNALFTFTNTGNLQSTITDIYFDWGTTPVAPFPLSFVSFSQTGNVSYVLNANPANLPGGNNIAFSADWSSQPDTPSGYGKKGIDNFNGTGTQDSLTIAFTGAAGSTFNDIIQALNNETLRIGIHVQSLSDEQSETYVTTPPVPEPGTIVLLGAGFLGLAAYGRKRIKK